MGCSWLGHCCSATTSGWPVYLAASFVGSPLVVLLSRSRSGSVQRRQGAEHRTMPQTGQVRARAVVYGGNVVWCDQAGVTKQPTQQSHDDKHTMPSSCSRLTQRFSVFCRISRGGCTKVVVCRCGEGVFRSRLEQNPFFSVKGSYFGGWLP